MNCVPLNALTPHVGNDHYLVLYTYPTRRYTHTTQSCNTHHTHLIHTSFIITQHNFQSRDKIKDPNYKQSVTHNVHSHCLCHNENTHPKVHTITTIPCQRVKLHALVTHTHNTPQTPWHMHTDKVKTAIMQSTKSLSHT